MTNVHATGTQLFKNAWLDSRPCLTRSLHGAQAKTRSYQLIRRQSTLHRRLQACLNLPLYTLSRSLLRKTLCLKRIHTSVALPSAHGLRRRSSSSVQKYRSQVRGKDFEERGVIMQGHLQFVTTPTADTPGSALTLSFLDRKYFFGHMHEGVQRAGLQHGAKFAKIQDFFLSGRTEWTSTGGLLGLILSVADTVKSTITARIDSNQQKIARAKKLEEEDEAQRANGKKKGNARKPKKALTLDPKIENPTLRIRSGPNLRHTLASARSFIFRQGMPIEVEEFGHDQKGPVSSERTPDFEDDRIKVWSLCARSQASSTSVNTTRSSPSRKRSHDDFIQGQNGDAAVLQDSQPTEQTNARSPEDTRKFLVKEMFQSQWSYNNLIEVPLHEVNLPANIFVRDPNSGDVISYKGPLPHHYPNVPNIPVLVREPWPGAVVKHLPPTTFSDVAVSYVVRGHEQRGRFRPDEAKRLGVTPGPLFRQLANGESVTTSAGASVTPEMVLEPSRQGGGFVILDIPSAGFVENTLSQLEEHSNMLLKDIKTFVWLLGPDISTDQRFKQFLQQRREITHVVSSPDLCENDFQMTSAAGQSARHHTIDAVRFPSLRGISHGEIQQMPVNTDGYLLARSGLKFQVVPESDFATQDTYVAFNESTALEELPQEILNTSQQIQADVTSEQVLSDVAKQDLPSPESEITFLGTGSMLPSLYRNVSATLLRVPNHGSYLFDCGENTLGQLQRLYSQEDLQEIFEDLKIIWISHLHADHHLGTLSVIRAWYEAVYKRSNRRSRSPQVSTTTDSAHVKRLLSGRQLFVVSNPLMARFLQEYSSVEDFGYKHIIPLSTNELHANNINKYPLDWDGLDVGFYTAESPELRLAMREATGLTNLGYCRVSHCWGANAVSFTFASGFKFSYSGDCRPSERFASIGRNSTVLLHEATFDDEHRDDAMIKRHSTISEALGVGAAMRAKRVLLTHFSQRFAKLPTIDDIDKSALDLEGAEDVTANEGDEADGPVDIPSDETPQNLKPKPREDQTPSSDADKLHRSRNRHPGSTVADAMKDMKVGIAFDHMRVKVKDIMLLEKLNPVLRELYSTKEDMPET